MSSLSLSLSKINSTDRCGSMIKALKMLRFNSQSREYTWVAGWQPINGSLTLMFLCLSPFHFKKNNGKKWINKTKINKHILRSIIIVKYFWKKGKAFIWGKLKTCLEISSQWSEKWSRDGRFAVVSFYAFWIKGNIKIIWNPLLVGG